MKKLSVSLVAVVAIALSVHAGDTVTSVNVVGYMTTDIAAGASDTYSLIAIPMTKLPVARGSITANTATSITDGLASWGNNMFAVGGSAVDEPGNSTYYVEITSGTFEGRYFILSGNDATTLNFANPGDLAADDLVGAGYKIIPANRIRDIFGEPGSPALKGSASADDADTIRLLTSGGWTASVFYKDSGLIGPVDHWVQGGSEADDLVIGRDEGVIVKRIGGEPLKSLTVTGEVSGNAQVVVVDSGYSLLNGMVAVDTAIGDSSLTDVLAGGASADEADTIRSWTGSGWSSSVFYKNSGLIGPVNTWVQDGADVADTFILEAGQAYLVKKNSTENTQWTRSSPL